MTDSNKGGRPAIGKQITVTVPQHDLDALSEMAAKAGVKQPDVIREIIRDAVVAAERAEAAAAPVKERLQPAATLIVDWISRGEDLAERRKRFKVYARFADQPFKLKNLLVRIAGSLAIHGAALSEVALDSQLVKDLVGSKASGSLPNWQLRTMLFFEVGTLMDERGVTVGPSLDGDGDDVDMEFEIQPKFGTQSSSDPDDDYA